MQQHSVGVRIVIIFFLSLSAVAVWLPKGVTTHSEYLTVRFLDVGQGDAIHIMTPDGYEMLVDGGRDASILRELARGRSFFDRSIDVVIATHPDSDHIAGLVDVMERYEVDLILETEVEHNTPAAAAYDVAAGLEGAEVITAQAGQVLQLGASTTVRVLSPYGDTRKWPNNNASIIVQVQYGDIGFMLTGDAPKSIEEYVVSKAGTRVESEVLKLGHHGSDTSTSALFLETVDPDFAVVSAGLDNRYGHPHSEVVERVREREVQMVSTAEVGTIEFQTDGATVWLME